MRILIGVPAGFLAARLAWVLLRPGFEQVVFLRENIRGRLVPTGVGIILPVSLVTVEAGRLIAGRAGLGGTKGFAPSARPATLMVALGMAMLGLFDDLGGGTSPGGFAGHLGSLRRGRLSTGGLKLLGGAAVSVIAVGTAGAGSLPGLLADAALVALAANLANLLDRAPGRAVKVTTVAFILLAALAGTRARLVPASVVAGAAVALLLDDLHEHLMLGDAGANVLGGVLGLGVVLSCSTSTRLAVLAVLAVLNVVAERVSFSAVIDRVGVLRALDHVGRRKTHPASEEGQPDE